MKRIRLSTINRYDRKRSKNLGHLLYKLDTDKKIIAKKAKESKRRYKKNL